MAKEKEEKKGFPKILLIILILLLVVGASFGGAYLGNKYYEKEANKETKEDNVDKKDKEEKEKTEEKNDEKQDGNIDEGKIEIEYEEEEMELKTKDKTRGFKHTRTYPSKISIDAKAEKKIIDYMKSVSDKEWESIRKESKEMIDDYEKGEYPIEEGLGVEYPITEVLVSNSVISFNFGMSGSMGGVMWSEVNLYNFDTKTGDLLTLEKVCLDVNACKNTLFNYYMEELKKDERFNDVFSDYEANIKKNIYKLGGWGFTNEGLELIVGKSEIADGASGLFIYTIPYSKVNSLLVEKYRQ
jgi:flagellar basal body-associated protein FliL